MPAKPNYKFEKKEREKSKALKKAERQKEKANKPATDSEPTPAETKTA